MNIPELKVSYRDTNKSLSLEDIKSLEDTGGLIWIEGHLCSIKTYTPNNKGQFRPVLSGHKITLSYKDKSPIETSNTKSPARTPAKKSLEDTCYTKMSPQDTAPAELIYQEGVPNQWTDEKGRVYVRGIQSGTWRVYPNGLEFGYWEDIDEHKVKARYAVEVLKK